MKIQHLEIYNIASIEKAYIDFEKAPLSDSDVFLITGKIGAGKSTILDAICLALYGTTPRISRGKNQKVEVNNDNLTSDDPRQLMRRNTGEAFVKLAFIGSDGNAYEAEWHVQRGERKKVDQALKPFTWSLKNNTNGDFLTNKNEVRETLQKAVGLDFDQFCRTTMLAQGEFTRFLSSDENDKAAILEKITGTEIYSRIGQAIFSINKEKKDAYMTVKEKVDDITPLTEDEIEKIKKDLADKENEGKAKQEEREAIQVKKNWLELQLQLKAKVEEAKQSCEDLKAALEQPDYKNAVRLVADWHDTLEVRHDLDEVNEKNRLVEGIIQSFSGELQEKYMDNLSGLHFLKTQLNDMKGNLATLAESLEAQDDKKDVFENGAEVLSLLREKVNLQKKSNVALDEKKKNEEKLPSLQRDVDDKDNKYKTLEKEYAITAEEVKKDRLHLAEMQLSELRKKHEGLLRSIDTVEKLLIRLKQLMKEANNMAELAKINVGLEAEINTLKNSNEKEESELKREEMILAALEQVLTISQQSVNQWTKQLRASLKEGCTCPVCQQTLKAALPLEDELEKAYRENLDKFEAQKKKVNDLRKALADHKGTLEAKRAQLSENQNRLTNRQLAQKKEEQNFILDGSSYGVQTVDAAEQQLNRFKKDKEDEDYSLKIKINEAEQFEQALNEKQKRLNELGEQKSSAFKEKTQTQTALDNCKLDIDRQSNDIATLSKDMEQKDQSIEKSLGNTLWPYDWHSDTIAFGQYFSKVSKQFIADKKRHEELEREVKDAEKTLDEIDSMQQKMVEIVPSWKELSSVENKEMRGLKTEWHELNDEVLKYNEKLAMAKADGKRAQHKVEAYLQSHHEIDMPRLLVLSKCSQAEVEKQKAEVEKQNEAYAVAKTKWETLTHQLEENEAKKPEGMTPDMTVDAMETFVESINEAILKLEQDKTLICKFLEDGINRNKEHENLQKQVEQCLEESVKWERLNKYFGDAQGNTFKKIAQSFILGSLLNTANEYLKTLHPRYALKVVPGTLYISLEDAYQGFATRSTSTLSGGESFLVSLSLALALADIGQNLAVDTLFIDEGFGSLSGNALANAINTLRNLHRSTGRHVGIISHVEEVKDSIPVQIKVIQEGNNSSSIIQVEP